MNKNALKRANDRRSHNVRVEEVRSLQDNVVYKATYLDERDNPRFDEQCIRDEKGKWRMIRIGAVPITDFCAILWVNHG